MNGNNNMTPVGSNEQTGKVDQYRNKEVQTYHIKWWTVRFYAIFAEIVILILKIAMNFIPKDADGILKIIQDLSDKFNLSYILLILGMANLAFILVLSFTILKKCKFDNWLLDLAKKRIGGGKIYYTRNRIYMTYDIGIKEKDKTDFITEASFKSDYFTYYLGDTYINDYVIEVFAKPKCPIPRKAPFDISKDIYWNLIPLGDCVNNELQTVSPVGWYLNGNNENDAFLPTIPSTSYLIAGGTGSGKSVAETSIIGHVSRFSDNFQLVGVDCKQVEFNLFIGVKGVKSVAFYPNTAAQAIEAFDKIMMQRFEFMRDQGYNNIYDIPTREVDYYVWHGEKFQFDEIFECLIKNNDKFEVNIMTIENIYKAIEEENKIVKIFGSYVIKGDITKTKDTFKVKALIFMSDELNQLMNSDDYKSVSIFKDKLGNIARLGRAAGVHLVLACQRASSNTISADLKNNIQICSLLGDFDSGSSSLMFDEDISHLSKPEIKGRGFTKSGKNLIEYQSYFDKPEKLIEFDTSRREVYTNKIYKKQCESNSSLPTEWVKPDWYRDELPKDYEKNVNNSDSGNKDVPDDRGPRRPRPPRNREDNKFTKEDITDDDIMAMFGGRDSSKKEDSSIADKDKPDENAPVTSSFASFRARLLEKQKNAENKAKGIQDEEKKENKTIDKEPEINIKPKSEEEIKKQENNLNENAHHEEKTKFKININKQEEKQEEKHDEKPKFKLKSN